MRSFTVCDAPIHSLCFPFINYIIYIFFTLCVHKWGPLKWLKWTVRDNEVKSFKYWIIRTILKTASPVFFFLQNLASKATLCHLLILLILSHHTYTNKQGLISPAGIQKGRNNSKENKPIWLKLFSITTNTLAVLLCSLTISATHQMRWPRDWKQLVAGGTHTHTPLLQMKACLSVRYIDNSMILCRPIPR